MTRPEGFSPAIREWLTSLAHNVPPSLRRKTLGVAVSGGADSVALFLTLLQLRGRAEFSLCVLHVDHNLRPDSADDAAWVESLAKTHDVPCFRTRLASPDPLSLRKEGLESWARRERLKWLTQQVHTRNIDTVVFGHHRQDQAETVLWRLLRGCGTAGLGGLRPFRRLVTESGTINIWRPFLNTSPETLRRFLAEAGQDWREDPTNAATTFLRNRIRHQILPYLSEFQPQIVRHLSALGNTMTEVHRALAARAHRYLSSSSPRTLFWKGSPTGPVLRELLRQWWIRELPEQAARFNLSTANRLEDLLVQNRSGRKLDLGFVQVARVPSGLEIIDSTIHSPKPRTALLFDSPVECHGQRITLHTSAA
ncbi:MAG TPA: tRNA lysidine(34) synthetase TilS, partial [Candidatus Ozemobacteraceae bacterium]|nr:tRNA lysidine(34) synthetase TilS [Candidatus Ozemobacteraceae bacterium]